MKAQKTPRKSWDWYPTPGDVTAVLRDAIAPKLLADARDLRMLDPAAGNGALISAMRAAPQFAEAHWSAIEIDPQWEDALEAVVEDVRIADALQSDWTPHAHVVANPPFCDLDAFWPRIVEHRDRYAVWCAALTPVAWWNATKRSGYAEPDIVMPLTWRPVFHVGKLDGAAHKGQQDFCWSILAPDGPHEYAVWKRAARPLHNERPTHAK